jgi:hypothetical protein
MATNTQDRELRKEGKENSTPHQTPPRKRKHWVLVCVLLAAATKAINSKPSQTLLLTLAGAF